MPTTAPALTPDAARALDEHQLREALARAVGAPVYPDHEEAGDDGTGLHECRRCGRGRSWKEARIPGSCVAGDYAHDLNALAGIKAKFTDEQLLDYGVYVGGSVRALVMSDARTQAIAVLLALSA